MWSARLTTTRDRRDEHDLIAILEGVGFASEEANVFVIHIDVNEAPELTGLILDLGRECGEVLVDIGDESRQVCGFAGELLLPVSVADEGGWKNDLDRNGLLLKKFIGVCVSTSGPCPDSAVL